MYLRMCDTPLGGMAVWMWQRKIKDLLHSFSVAPQWTFNAHKNYAFHNCQLKWNSILFVMQIKILVSYNSAESFVQMLQRCILKIINLWHIDANPNGFASWKNRYPWYDLKFLTINNIDNHYRKFPMQFRISLETVNAYFTFH